MIYRFGTAEVKSVRLAAEKDEDGIYYRTVAVLQDGNQYVFDATDAVSSGVGVSPEGSHSGTREPGSEPHPSQEFKRGDVVALRSGGPAMTVLGDYLGIEKGRYAVTFFHEGELKNATFPGFALVRVPGVGEER